MPKYAELIYNGFWYSPEREMLQALIDKSQQFVTGDVTVKLYKGSAVVEGRTSPHALYSYELATYDDADQFDHTAALGFITIWGLPTKIGRALARKD